MSERGQRKYCGLDRAERAAIERGSDKNRLARVMTADLRRSPSSVADEVGRNHIVARSAGKGGGSPEPPDGLPQAARAVLALM